MIDKRKDQRLDCEASIVFSYFAKDKTFNGRMLNFSKNGMYFEFGEFIKSGAAIYSRLRSCAELPSDPERCEGLRSVSLAEVRWCKKLKNKGKPCFGIGLKYY